MEVIFYLLLLFSSSFSLRSFFFFFFSSASASSPLKKKKKERFSRERCFLEVFHASSVYPSIRTTFKWRWVWRNGGIMLTGEDRSTWRKTCLSATLSTINFTWTDFIWNPNLRDDRPGTNRPSRDTALKHKNQPNYILRFSLYRPVITRRLGYSNHSVHASLRCLWSHL